MPTQNDVLNILRANRDALLARWPIASLSLFGSVARGDQTAHSDVDLLIELSGPMGWNFFDLADELQTLLGVKVDLIPKAALNPTIGNVSPPTS